jgi:hypothetical protein
MQFSEANNKHPILIDSEFSQPDHLQLHFRPMGKYTASTFMSHIRIPFNCSGLLGLQHKLNDRLDNFSDVLKKGSFKLSDYELNTLNSMLQLFKGNTDEIFNFSMISWSVFPMCQHISAGN